MKKPYDMEGLKEILKKLNNYKFVKERVTKLNLSTMVLFIFLINPK